MIVIVDWIYKNKEWLFSGILVPILFGTWTWLKSMQKNKPLAVGYESFGPFNFPLPHAILKEGVATQAQPLVNLDIFALIIDNYSSTSCKELRILYTGGSEYSPQLEFQNRDVEVKCRIDDQSKEILIDEIPPGETVSVAFFNPLAGFSIRHVLIGDSEITKSMRKMAQAKRYPHLYWFGRITSCVLIFAMATMFYTGYALWKTSKDQKIISSVTGDLQGCTPTVIYGSNENQDDLNRQFLTLNYPYDRLVLAMNKVTSLQELDEKKIVIFCKPIGH